MNEMASLPDWIRTVARSQKAVGSLLDASGSIPTGAGYQHTLREILQQPATWIDTAARVLEHRPALSAFVHGSGGRPGARALALTGSGSSLYAGECVARFLQRRLGIPAQAVSGGDLLTDGAEALAPVRPCVLVSLARSGNSPESCAAVSSLLNTEPDCHHLIITCNNAGRLALEFSGDSRVFALTLDQSTCDLSLAMTSSFTNMVLAATGLGLLEFPERYQALVERLSRLCRVLLLEHTTALAELARQPFRSAVFLGTGCRFGSARESALKLQEMSAGRVFTFAETFLGLRHGPMASVREDTLVVCFVSSDPLARAYEMDLVRELDRKGLGGPRLLFGENVPSAIVRSDDVVIDLNGLSEIGDDHVAVLDVVAGQLLAFYRSLAEGLDPDQPSTGAISRVVEQFKIYERPVEAAR